MEGGRADYPKQMGQAQRTYTEEELEVAIRLHDDYEYYAKKALKIKPKDKNAPGIENGVIPLIFNTAQRYLQWRLDKQWREIGKTRAFVVKGRQQGCSTWIEGLYFHETTLNYGIKTFIQTHSKKATKNLYKMAHRYLKHLPDDVRPHVSVSNTDDLEFDELDSGYTVSTAGSAETGRSDTIDKLHGSEVAFWKSTLDHTTGLLQAVPDVKGSRVVLESTANGPAGYFYNGYITAERGENGDYIAIFIPWYWQEEYSKELPEGFTLTQEEQKYVDLYDTFPVFDENGECTIIKKKLTLKQMAWRRAKIAEFEGNVAKFNQEYPATAQMAFQFSATDSFIAAEDVLEALKRPEYMAYGPITAGFDPAFTDNENSDRKAFIYRQGPNLFGLEYPKLDGHGASLAYLKRKLDSKIIVIDRLFIDAGGGGYALYDCLCDDGYEDQVEIINSASADPESHKYANIRAGMSDRLKKALTDEHMPVSIMIDKKLEEAYITDMTAEGWKEDGNNRLLIEKKEDVKKRLGISPEGKDVSALTYAKQLRMNNKKATRQTKVRVNYRRRA